MTLISHACIDARLLLLNTRLKIVFSRCEDVAINRNARDHLVWTIGNGDAMHRVYVSHTGYLTYGNIKDEIAGSSRHQNHSKKVVRNIEEIYVGTIRGKVPNKA